MNSRTITSAWLREQRPAAGVIPIGVDIGLVLADALDIADLAARVQIELDCKRDREGWWDSSSFFAPYEEDTPQLIAQALRYLDARGLIQRKDGEAHLVRMGAA